MGLMQLINNNNSDIYNLQVLCLSLPVEEMLDHHASGPGACMFNASKLSALPNAKRATA